MRGGGAYQAGAYMRAYRTRGSRLADVGDDTIGLMQLTPRQY